MAVDFLYVPHVAVINIFYRAFFRTDQVTVSSRKSYGILVKTLEPGDQLLVDQAGINHCHYLKCLFVCDPPSIFHLRHDAHTFSKSRGQHAATMDEDLFSGKLSK